MYKTDPALFVKLKVAPLESKQLADLEAVYHMHYPLKNLTPLLLKSPTIANNYIIVASTQNR